MRQQRIFGEELLIEHSRRQYNIAYGYETTQNTTYIMRF